MFFSIIVGTLILANTINYVGCDAVDYRGETCEEYSKLEIKYDYPDASDF